MEVEAGNTLVVLERSLKSLPGSFKLWNSYLKLLVKLYLPHPDRHETLNNAFERSLATMHKMPRVWIMYLQCLMDQKFITRTRRVFDRALCALPVSQHHRIWDLFLKFVGQEGIPVQTVLRVHRRFLMFEPSHVENFITFLLDSGLWRDAALMLTSILNDETFVSVNEKTKHTFWLELCDLINRHAEEVSDALNVDAIIRTGIAKFTDYVAPLWTCLAEFYIRRGLLDKACDVFEEAMATVVTVRDFALLFDTYSQLQEGLLAHRMDHTDDSSNDDIELGPEGVDNNEQQQQDARLDPSSNFEKKLFQGFWLDDSDNVDLMLARLEHLMDRRPALANSVLLRQNPHTVKLWHRRVKLFEADPAKQVQTFVEAVTTVDPMKAVGNPHTLWIALAELYERHGDLCNARLIFEKAVQANFKAVDHLVTVWCAWAQMEVRHCNFEGALELLERATAEPSPELKRRVAAEGNEPVQMKAHKSSKLWALYVDTVKGLGTFELTRALYERILNLRIATPTMFVNYALLLEEHKYFEDAFKICEKGVKIFKYPHVKDLWIAYLSMFVKSYGRTKLEMARELFENAIEIAPADAVKPLYLRYANLEQDCGSARRAMEVYDRATKAVPDNEKLSMYGIYMARAAEMYGVTKTREIYEQAIESGLLEKDIKTMCLRYAELETSLGEIDRARGIYVFASQSGDLRSDVGFWNKWHEFEVEHGNEDTFRDMMLIKRSFSEKCYSVSQRVESQYDGGMLVNAGNQESDCNDFGRVEIVQKDVAVVVGKRKVPEKAADDVSSGCSVALQRLKRQKQG